MTFCRLDIIFYRVHQATRWAVFKIISPEQFFFPKNSKRRWDQRISKKALFTAYLSSNEGIREMAWEAFPTWYPFWSDWNYKTHHFCRGFELCFCLVWEEGHKERLTPAGTILGSPFSGLAWAFRERTGIRVADPSLSLPWSSRLPTLHLWQAERFATTPRKIQWQRNTYLSRVIWAKDFPKVFLFQFVSKVRW